MLLSKELLGIIGVALVLIAYIPYLRDIIRGKVKPHPFSWFVWSVSAALIFLIQTNSGSGPGAYTTLTIAILAFCVFVLAYRYNKTRIKPLDIVCLAAACVGLIFWLLIDQPLISIFLLLGIELIGFIPTLRKGIKLPYEDSATLWGVNSVRHAVGIAAISSYNPITLLNPLMWLVVSVSFCLLLVLRRTKVKKPKGRKRQFRPHN